MKCVHHDRKVEWVLEGEVNIVLAWMKTDYDIEPHGSEIKTNYACAYF